MPVHKGERFGKPGKHATASAYISEAGANASKSHNYCTSKHSSPHHVPSKLDIMHLRITGPISFLDDETTGAGVVVWQMGSSPSRTAFRDSRQIAQIERQLSQRGMSFLIMSRTLSHSYPLSVLTS